MQSRCAISHCSSLAATGSPFCTDICEEHSMSCGAPVDLELSTVGDKDIYLAPSGITFRNTGASIGLGLYAARPFNKAEPITEYYGYVFKDSVVPADRLEHAIEAAGGWVIDGTRAADGTPLTDPVRQLQKLNAGGGAYANDLDFPRVSGMDPSSVINPPGAKTNAIFRRAMDQQTKARLERGESIGKDEFVIFLEASEPIAAGEEIFVSYNLMVYMAPKRDAAAAGSTGSSRRKPANPKRRPPGNQEFVSGPMRLMESGYRLDPGVWLKMDSGKWMMVEENDNTVFLSDLIDGREKVPQNQILEFIQKRMAIMLRPGEDAVHLAYFANLDGNPATAVYALMDENGCLSYVRVGPLASFGALTLPKENIEDEVRRGIMIAPYGAWAP